VPDGSHVEDHGDDAEGIPIAGLLSVVGPMRGTSTGRTM
jgi:hypothetical protein